MTYRCRRKLMRKSTIFGAIAAAWLAALALPALAQEQPEFATDSEGKACQVIPKAGYAITKPGRYCLTHDLFMQWRGENLNAPIHSVIYLLSADVVLDLNGFTIGYRQVNPLVSPNGGSGIDQTNVTLRNVVIRNGKISRFQRGIKLPLSSNAELEGALERWNREYPEFFKKNQISITIEDITFEDNKVDAYLFGRDIVLRHNKFLHKGLSERQREDWSGNPIGQPNSYAAVIIHGQKSEIADNQFELSGPVRGLPFAFVYVYDGDGLSVHHNTFINRSDQSASTHGIAFRNTTQFSLEENKFQGLDGSVLKLPSF